MYPLDSNVSLWKSSFGNFRAFYVGGSVFKLLFPFLIHPFRSLTKTFVAVLSNKFLLLCLPFQLYWHVWEYIHDFCHLHREVPRNLLPSQGWRGFLSAILTTDHCSVPSVPRTPARRGTTSCPSPSSPSRQTSPGEHTSTQNSKLACLA